ncbi:MAG: hypothetical protein JXX14_23205 [Deltaproteobacteria bacterium]|nr:hypothetical protein [Deltaproteobacteria bacterium]
MNQLGPTIKEADAAYNRGDFPTARKLAQTVLKDESLDPTEDPTEDPTDVAVARQILKAIDFDPIAAVGFGVTLFLLVFISIKFLV